jgi:hypothetical protein
MFVLLWSPGREVEQPMNYWTVKVHTTLGCRGMWGRETVGWSVDEVWYLSLDYVDIDCGSWLSWQSISLMES